MAGDRGSIVFGVTIDYQLRYHDGLYQRLADAGWDVHVVAGPGPIGRALEQHPGVSAHVLEMARAPNLIADLRGIKQWVQLMKRLRPDVVVVGTPKAGLLGSLAAWLVRVPQRVYELHGLRLESATGLLRTVLKLTERISCAASTRVIAVGSSLRERAVSECLAPANKVEVLGAGSPNGVDLARFDRARDDDDAKASLRAALGIPESSQVVTFVGRLTADKGLAVLLEAMVILQCERSAWLMVIGGVDDETGLDGERRLRESLRHVALIGEVDDVAPYLAISDVFCLPSRREGLPTVVLEAFASRVPVVATQATGIIDLVSESETGRLVPVDDAAALYLALQAALVDEDWSKQMAEAAWRTASEKFSHEVVQSAWLDTIELMRTKGER